MERVSLASNVYHLQSGSNMGLVVRESQALLIDVGLDSDAARRALRSVEEQQAELVAIVVTHAHADHFGGAHFLQQRMDVPVYAPVLEGALMEHPIIEPLYLFGGAAPIRELRKKFTLAESCKVQASVAPGSQQIGPFQVDIVPLPGHALNQVGVGIPDSEPSVLFCADAVFPRETIEKHKVLFCVDLDQTLDTIARLPTLAYDCLAPGHGPAYQTGEAIEAICEANYERLLAIREAVYEGLAAPQETSALVQSLAKRFSLVIATPTAYYLTRATVLAALSSLESGGRVMVSTEADRVLWKRT